MDGSGQSGNGLTSGLRLNTAEMFTLCLVRLWTMAHECECGAAECTLSAGFARGHLDAAAAEEFGSLLLILSTGRRPLCIAELNAAFVTDDEIGLLSLLASAQQSDLDATIAALRRWLPPAGVRIALRAAIRFARCLHRQELVLRTADAVLSGVPIDCVPRRELEVGTTSNFMH